MKVDRWYQRRLAKYFEEHYMKYEDTAGWWNDPAPNQWLFDIQELGIRVELICDEEGKIHEQRYKLM